MTFVLLNSEKQELEKAKLAFSILGKPEFECSPGGNISTWNCMKKITSRFNKHILVIDTPGLQDNETQSHNTRSEVQHSIQMAFNVSRVPKQDQLYFYCV